MNAWLVFLIVLVPFLILLGFIGSSDSLITIPPGNVGLLLKSGQATDTVLQPGLHWVPRLRKRTVAPYPSVELAFRAVPDAASPGEAIALDRHGPALRVTLGDRGQATIGYPSSVWTPGPPVGRRTPRSQGFWNSVRDVSGPAVRHRLGDPDVAVDDLYGDRRNALEDQIGEVVKDVLQEEGVVLTMFCSATSISAGRAT